jgi:hypothetical protein
VSRPERRRSPSPVAATKRPRKAKAPFLPSEALAFADGALSLPPKLDHIERRPGIGVCVARWALPLHLCPGVNVLAEMPNWKRAKVKEAALGLMWMQSGGKRAAAPLRGRPMVRCIRFSSVEPDDNNSHSKVPVDRLTTKNGGLGYLVDDKPRNMRLATWWEPAPPGKGCVLVEVWTGEEEE